MVKVPPTTMTSDGMLMNTSVELPSDTAITTTAKEPMRPNNVAKSITILNSNKTLSQTSPSPASDDSIASMLLIQ